MVDGSVGEICSERGVEFFVGFGIGFVFGVGKEELAGCFGVGYEFGGHVGGALDDGVGVVYGEFVELYVVDITFACGKGFEFIVGESVFFEFAYQFMVKCSFKIVVEEREDDFGGAE